MGLDLNELLNLPILVFLAHRVWVISTKFPLIERLIEDHEKRIKTLEEKVAAGGGPGAYKSGGAQGAEEEASSPEDDKDEM